MQNQTFRNFLLRLLRDGKTSSSLIGNSVKQTGDYDTLIRGGFIEFLPSVTGGGSVYVKNREALLKYFTTKFPGEPEQSFTAIANVKTFRNSKAAKRESQNVILLRGHQKVQLNGILINLEEYTNSFNTFSAVLKSLETPMVCFVENLDCYLLAEKIIDRNYVFIHTYGGLSKEVVKRISTKKVLVFPDYDYKGLHNYLLIKSVFDLTELFIPPDYDNLFMTRSRTIETKHGREQQPSKQVLESQDEIVVKIRTEIFKHRKYLEQQAIFK